MPAKNITRGEFVALVASLMALNSLAVDVMLPALPAMGEALGIANENERQFVIIAYMAGFGLAQLVYGPIADSYGRRPPLLAGMVLYVCCAVAAAFCTQRDCPVLATLPSRARSRRHTRHLQLRHPRPILWRGDGQDHLARAHGLHGGPIVAPGIGQLILAAGTWHTIFIFMGVMSSFPLAVTPCRSSGSGWTTSRQFMDSVQMTHYFRP